MRRVRAGLIGAGFVGPLHVEAVRRLGFVDVVALAASSEESARRKAETLNIERAYADYNELLLDPTIEVVHVCTPNNLHHQVVMAAIQNGKHVICDKPLALTSVEAREMRDRARDAGVVNAVTFNYRFNPLVQQAREMIARGDIGKVRFVQGYYLQDWLLFETDFSWRLEAQKGGASSSVGDIGSHWCDTAQFISGLRITRVLASLSTMVQVRKKPTGAREAFAAANVADQMEDYVVTSDDLGSVLVEFEDGARGVFTVGQVCPGHKNDMRIEVAGSLASVQWEQERPDEMWIGYRDKPNVHLRRDPALLSPEVRRYSSLPGGHGQGWADAFRNLMMNIYGFIAGGLDPVQDSDSIDFPTFEDGYRVNCIVDAIVRSNVDRSRWTAVEYS
ncbi:MAG TPA: Gfo/Idh/MocA family oxidoreductase [Blastocatellia bacterium]|nr:Gfo/Idh/MocA family oxidoreductase [Blastocatellia bacterium]